MKKKLLFDNYFTGRYDDSIVSRWTARHAFSSKLAFAIHADYILNIGTYNGWLESNLLSQGRKNIVSVDVERKNIESTKQAVPQTDFVVASAVNLPFRQNTFDLLTLYEVIEHIPKGKEKNCLFECKRVLNEKGTLLLSTPFNALISKLLDPAWYLGHRHYSVTQLTSIAEKTGFVNRKTYVKGRFFEEFCVILLYIFKRVGLEIPFKSWFERRRLSEYATKGFNTVFIVFKKK